MNITPEKFIHVLGTGWSIPAQRRLARMIGTTLAEAGFGLVAGNSHGVDYWVANAFCAERRFLGLAVAGAYVQVTLGGRRFFLRGGMPIPGYAAPEECKVWVRDIESWKRESLGRSHAAVMVGGGWGALNIARRYIEQGRPVFPLPFTGGITGNSDRVFREILKTWESYPVPGLSRNQFLRLAEPWVSGTGPLANLLRGTLALAPDVFVSYRRADAPSAAGRLAYDLREYFGQRRVFLDIGDIDPGQSWRSTIESGLRKCRVGVVVIGRNWLGAGADGGKLRLQDPEDVVRAEIAALIEGGKPIFPVLVEGARLPEANELPDELKPLLRYQVATLDNGDWEARILRLARKIEGMIRPEPVGPRESQSETEPENGSRPVSGRENRN